MKKFEQNVLHRDEHISIIGEIGQMKILLLQHFFDEVTQELEGNFVFATPQRSPGQQWLARALCSGWKLPRGCLVEQSISFLRSAGSYWLQRP